MTISPSISFSLILPAVPKYVIIVLSESGVISIKQVPVGNISFFFLYRYSTFSLINPSSYLIPRLSSEIFPIKPTSLPSWDNPTIEFATDPPDTVFSIVNSDNNFLNSLSSKMSFIVLLVNLFFLIKSSSTLQITSTIALPIPKIFILSFFCLKRFFPIRITSGTNFTRYSKTISCFTIFPTIINYLEM